MAAIMGGEIQILLVGLATVLPHVRAKSEKLKILAVTSARRAAAGLEPLGNTPAEFTAQIRGEIPKWLKVARDANIQVD